MDDFFKMDVFFVATTGVVIALGVLLIVALFYVIRILKSFDEVMKNVTLESNDIRDDIRILRARSAGTRRSSSRIRRTSGRTGTWQS